MPEITISTPVVGNPVHRLTLGVSEARGGTLGEVVSGGYNGMCQVQSSCMADD